jgi:hypothetical protein
MERLTATFGLLLTDHHLFIYELVEQSQSSTVGITIDGFDVGITFPREGMRSGRGRVGDPLMIRAYDQVAIRVTRSELESPPEKCPEEHFVTVPYFDVRAPQYRQAAATALNRLFAFFRRNLHQPFIRLVSADDPAFRNPRWTDQDGKDVGKAFIQGWVARSIPGMDGMTLSVKAGHLSEIEAALQLEVGPLNLYEEFRLNAQDAALSGDLRRAVLELAVCCEVAVKHRIFPHPSPASAACEYIERQRPITIKDLIANVELGGKTFRAQDPIAHEDIDHLFRCRNRIAHRGESSYRDDQGTTHQLDKQKFEQWWVSVDKLMTWLASD